MEIFPHRLNVAVAGSDLRVQIQTDPRYATFVDRATEREVLGLRLPVARVEDVLQGKLWAVLDPARRASKRQKDLADIARLLEAYPDLRDQVPSEVLAKLSPVEAAIEQTFVNRDASATLKLGQARGIAMLVPALSGVTIAEYAPNAVKKTVVGAGHGDKVQIRAMVARLLPRAVPDSADAADALAIAITHAHCRAWRKLEAAVALAGGDAP